MTRKRLDGWKAIAAYFRRDRSTVMRWTRDRQLPVRRLPGGKQGSVFAWEDELAAWAERLDAGGEPVALAPAHGPGPVDDPLAGLSPPAARPEAAGRAPSGEPAPEPRVRQRRWINAAAAAIAALALLAGVLGWQSKGRHMPMPRDPAVAADFVRARDLWGYRRADDLSEAVRLYQSVIRRQPDFAPAYAGLADVWLVLREYGTIDDAKAYPLAQRAAERALQLDPTLPGPHRALGFIDHWWRNLPAASLRAFRRAIELDDDDAQTHFWYANVLADLGFDREAQQHYSRAQLLQPGSAPLAVEQAMSHWLAGRDAQALAALTALARRHPQDATIHGYLAWVHLSHGDIRAFAAENRTMARLRAEPTLLARADRLEAAIARDPATAHRVVIAEMRAQIADGTRFARDTPAFYASCFGDRAELVQLLEGARNNGERWYSHAITSRIAARWRGDRQVLALLGAVRGTITSP